MEPPGLNLPRSPGLPRGSFTRFPKDVWGVSTQLKTQLERTEAILEDEQTQRQKLTAEFEEVRPCLGVLSHQLCWGWWRVLPLGLLLCSCHLPHVHRLELLSHHAGRPSIPNGLVEGL